MFLYGIFQFCLIEAVLTVVASGFNYGILFPRQILAVVHNASLTFGAIQLKVVELIAMQAAVC